MMHKIVIVIALSALIYAMKEYPKFGKRVFASLELVWLSFKVLLQWALIVAAIYGVYYGVRHELVSSAWAAIIITFFVVMFVGRWAVRRLGNPHYERWTAEDFEKEFKRAIKNYKPGDLRPLELIDIASRYGVIFNQDWDSDASAAVTAGRSAHED
jgi:hypothetical protein